MTANNETPAVDVDAIVAAAVAKALAAQAEATDARIAEAVSEAMNTVPAEDKNEYDKPPAYPAGTEIKFSKTSKRRNN
jgi:hypothetical protein